MFLENIKTQILVGETILATTTERKSTLNVLPYLAEIDRRKAYLEYDCESMIKFCTKEFKYSETAAIRRVKAARLLRDVPSILPALKEGKLNLTTLSIASDFFKG